MTETTTTPRARRQATDRVLRMLSVVPWIAAHDGPTVAEVCERFDLEPGQLIEDLNVVQFVGLPPYTPDTLIEVTFDDDRVWVRFAEVFSRPLRLAPDQALALVAAGAALSGEVPGPLQSGLDKLAGLLGVAPEDAIAIRLGSSRPQVMETLRQAVREQRRLHLDYFVYSRDERTERDVDPYRVFALRGAWYLIGWCHLSQDVRTFRIDRIYHADLLAETFELPERWAATAAEDAGNGDTVFEIDPDVPRIVLDLPPDARWVVETYPVDDVVDGADGRFQVRLPVASRVWLERLLLRLGRDAVMVESTDPELHGIRQAAARRLLARYTGPAR